MEEIEYQANHEDLDMVMETCQSKREMDEFNQKSPNCLEREILNEISKQEVFSQDLINRIETLETDIFMKNSKFIEKNKYTELFPEEKENNEVLTEKMLKNQAKSKEVLEKDKKNEDFRYSKMSESQAANLYEERMSELMIKFANNPANKKKNMKSMPPKKKIPEKAKTPSSSNQQQAIETKKPMKKTQNYLKKPEKTEKIEKKNTKTTEIQAFSMKPHKTLSSKRNSSKDSLFKSNELYQKGLEHLNFRQQLMLENQEKRLSQEISECTFTPILHKKPNYLKTYENIIDRTRRSQQKKEQKSLDFYNSRHESELKECTFTPNISHNKGKNKEALSNNSFHKSGSSSSLKPRKTLRTLSKSSLKSINFSNSSSRKSIKEDDKTKFRKANEAFLKNKLKKQGFFFDFEENEKKKQKNQEKTKLRTNNSRVSMDQKAFPEEISKEITETLDIFNRIRHQMKSQGDKSSKNALKDAKKEKNLSISKRSLSRKNSGIDKKLNSIGKTEFIRKPLVSKDKKKPEKFVKKDQKSLRKTEEKEKETKETRFSKKILELYKEDLKPNKPIHDPRNRNIGKITKNEGGLAKRYEGLLKQAENITQHLNNVLYAK